MDQNQAPQTVDQRDLSQIRILSIDGGGIRGVMPAYWLVQLENQLSSLPGTARFRTYLKSAFDWFIGTSTGAIIAAGLALDKTPQEILKLYEDKSSTIFPTFWAGGRYFNPLRWSGSLFPKYSDVGLNQVLVETFGDKTFGSIDPSKRLLIVSYNAGTRQPVVFDSSNSRFRDILIWEACRASAAAPTYLPEAVFELDGVKTAFLDGGVVANDPAAIAVAKVMGLRLDSESALVVSFGTGQTGTGFNPDRFWQVSGTMPWLPSLTTTLMEAGNGAFESMIENTLNSNHYYRFNASLKLAKPEMDDASNKQILALKTDANDYWLRRSTREMCDALLRRLDCQPLIELDSLAGLWKSTFTYTKSHRRDNQKVNESVMFSDVNKVIEKIRIDVLWHSFLHGQTIESDYPGQFQASQVGDCIVGQWYNPEGNLASNFVLFRETGDLVKGRWIGCGDDEMKLFDGEWTWERIKPERDEDLPPSPIHLEPSEESTSNQ